MGLLKKVSIINKLAYSKVKEKVKCEYVSRKNINSCMIKEEIKEEENSKRESYFKELKKEIKISKEDRKEKNKKLSTLERVKGEFRGIPVISVVDDIVEGASQIEKVKKFVTENPEDPLAWLMMAECIKYHKKIFLIINLAKTPIDPIGTVLDIGVEFGGDAIEGAIDKDKWTYKRALLKSLNLGFKASLKDEKTLVCIGKSAKLLAAYSKDPIEKENYSLIGDKYLRKALEIGSRESKNEILFYLDKLSKNKVKKFKYAYNSNKLISIVNGGSNAVVKQSGKVVNTLEKILDNTLDKLIKERKV
ncbi:hypothetical protein GCM10008905_13150 [Clostridium malenominatum]|uniref:Uncharacterized protein n=1 Tax=Clostridium malenominatum TaxID=1539 RepID=A0ABP3U6J9_9CLOT